MGGVGHWSESASFARRFGQIDGAARVDVLVFDTIDVSAVRREDIRPRRRLRRADEVDGARLCLLRLLRRFARRRRLFCEHVRVFTLSLTRRSRRSPIGLLLCVVVVLLSGRTVTRIVPRLTTLKAKIIASSLLLQLLLVLFAVGWARAATSFVVGSTATALRRALKSIAVVIAASPSTTTTVAFAPWTVALEVIGTAAFVTALLLLSATTISATATTATTTRLSFLMFPVSAVVVGCLES